MKIIINLLCFLSLSYSVYAQTPIVKVDLNMSGRQEAEVNEPGYQPWVITQGTESSTTLSNIGFIFTTINPEGSTLKTGWSKLHIQDPYYARLANDGVFSSNNSGGDIEFRIAGLPIGQHSLQTFHNTWDNPANNAFSPFNVYLNGNLVHDNIEPTNRVEVNSHATTLYTRFKIDSEGEEVVLLFESDKTFTTTEQKGDGTLKNSIINVCINGFELNTHPVHLQATEPFPSDANLHVDADDGFIKLEWKPAESALNNFLYFGADSNAVASATPESTSYIGQLNKENSSYRVGDLYSMNTYYWRVDQEDAEGMRTPGEVWSFRPRQIAFRGAEGYGRYAIGGRDGKVVVVTNLNDDGPGSLREAMTNDIGPRTIVFNVSGIIDLKSRLVLNQKFVTIAGQTAPGKGILIRSAPFGIGSESICRFIRVRLGAGETADGMGMAGANHSIIDHCSVGWTIDEAFSSRNSKNITLQRTLISEALNIAGHKNYPAGSAHGYAATIGGDVGSFHHNLLAHCYGRNWSLGGGLDGAGYYAGKLDIFNNVVYNWGTRATDGGAHQVNFVNNYYKKGVATTQNTILKAQLEGLGKGSQSYYYSGNIIKNTNGTLICDGTNDSCSRTYVTSGGQIVNWEVFVSQPFFPSQADIESAKDAYKSVLSDVGCIMPIFDEHDQRIINETMNGTFTFTGSKSKKGGIIDHQDDAGGYEDYPEVQRPGDFDSDLDGLPDWWELLHGTHPNSPEGDFSDANIDRNNDGYTLLEEYLEWMSVPRYYIDKNGSKTIDLSPLVFSAIKEPTYEIDDNTDLTVEINGKNAILYPKSNFEGISYLDVKVKDKENSVINRRIGVLVQNDNSTTLNSLYNDNRFKVYPQNFYNQINIETYSATNQKIMISLIQMNGVEMFKSSHNLTQGRNHLKINYPENLPKQLYLLKITNVNTKELLKAVKLIKTNRQ